MNFETERDGKAPRATETKVASDKGDNPTRGRGSRGGREPKVEVGAALRTAYQQTVDETIPPEMLDLLGKLA